MDQDDELYKEKLRQPLFVGNRIPEWMQMESYARKLVHLWGLDEVMSVVRNVVCLSLATQVNVDVRKIAGVRPPAGYPPDPRVEFFTVDRDGFRTVYAELPKGDVVEARVKPVGTLAVHGTGGPGGYGAWSQMVPVPHHITKVSISLDRSFGKFEKLFISIPL